MFPAPTPTALNRYIRLYSGEPGELRSLPYDAIHYVEADGHREGGYMFTAPPGTTYPPGPPHFFTAVPEGFNTPCAPGWAFSDNDIGGSGHGIGVYLDKERLVRPVAGVDASAVSASVLGEGWRILTLQVSAQPSIINHQF